jgi:hypothetical protein
MSSGLLSVYQKIDGEYSNINIPENYIVSTLVYVDVYSESYSLSEDL